MKYTGMYDTTSLVEIDASLSMRLVEIQQEETYRGHMVGEPRARVNDRIIESHQSKKHRRIEGVRNWIHIDPERTYPDSETQECSKLGAVEYLPLVACAGLLTGTYTTKKGSLRYLDVACTWYQAGFGLDSTVVGKLRAAIMDVGYRNLFSHNGQGI